MSVEATTRAWKSGATGNDLLVLLALADFAGGQDDPFDFAYPSVATLEGMTRLSRRTVQRCLRSLEEQGEIRSTGQHQWSPKKVTIQYRIEGRQIDAPSVDGASQETLRGVTAVTHNPPVEPIHNSLARPREVLDLNGLQASEKRVLAMLRFVAVEKNADLNERRALQIMKDYPDRDHIAEAEKFEHWHLQGKGQNVQRRNLTTAWRNWLDASAPKREKGQAVGGARRQLGREREVAERLYPHAVGDDAVKAVRGALSWGAATDDGVREWMAKWRPDIESGEGNSGQWCELHDIHQDDPQHDYHYPECERRLREATPEENATLSGKGA